LSLNNSIITAGGYPLNSGEGCNGDEFYYELDNGTWTSSYLAANGSVIDYIDLFYATEDKLNIRTIQVWQNNMAEILNNRTGALMITCNNGHTSCIKFKINGVEEEIPNAVPPFCAAMGTFQYYSVFGLVAALFITVILSN
jgi:hypothetical protein